MSERTTAVLAFGSSANIRTVVAAARASKMIVTTLRDLLRLACTTAHNQIPSGRGRYPTQSGKAMAHCTRFPRPSLPRFCLGNADRLAENSSALNTSRVLYYFLHPSGAVHIFRLELKFCSFSRFKFYKRSKITWHAKSRPHLPR